MKQGDLLASVNGIDLTNLNHIEIVEILKNHCQIGEETRFTVKRFKRTSEQPNKIGKEEIDKEISLLSHNKASDDLVPKIYDHIYNQTNLNVQNNQQQQDAIQIQSNNKLNDNLIAELKANLALNNNSSSLTNVKNNSGDLINSPSSTTSLLINSNYSNVESVNEQNDLNCNNIYNLTSESNQNNYMNSTMLINDGNQSSFANEDEFEYFRAYLTRSETNFSFGFRIVGGREENRPVTIGSIVIGGVAHLDGILKAGDEICEINDQNVMNASHHYVVKLMSECGNNVSLLVRRRKDCDAFDVILNRDPNDTFGFGFVIISCNNCALIGRIIDNSPASRCGRLKVRDKIIAVNNVNITQMNHPDIVNMIKDSGLTLKLRYVDESID